MKQKERPTVIFKERKISEGEIAE